MDNELISAIRQVVREEIKTEIAPLKKDVSGLKEDVSVLKSDVSGLKEDVSGLKSDVSGLKEDVSMLKSDVSGLKEDVSGLKVKINSMDQKIDHLDTRQQMIYEQTGKLTEFRTEANEKLDTIIKDIDYLKHKEQQNEQAIYHLREDNRRE